MPPTLTVSSRQIVGQLTGSRVVPSGYILTPTVPLLNEGRDADVCSGDIANLWDTGDGRVGIGMGDCQGLGWGGGPGANAAGLATHRLGLGNAPRLATDFAGASLFMESTAGFPTNGIIHIETGGSELDGWASFSYEFASATPFPSINNVIWLAGNGTVVDHANASIADLRTNGGLRPNLLAVSSDTSLAGGVTIDDWYTDASGVAIPPWPRTFTPGSLGAAFPSFASGTNPIVPITQVTQVGFEILISTAPNLHGLEDGRPPPGGPPTYIGGFNAIHTTLTSATTFNTADAPFLAGTGVIDVATTAGMVDATGTNAERRIAVQHIFGYSIIQYTGLTPTSFTGCTFLSFLGGAGFSGAGGAVIQGVGWFDIFGNFVTPNAKDHMIWDVKSPTLFSILSFSTAGQPRSGGKITPGHAFAHFPNNVYTATPDTAPREGNVTMGGCYVPHVGAHNNCRQLQFVQSILWNSGGQITTYGTSCDLWYCDGDIATSPWVKGPMWENTPTCDGPVQEITPYYDADDAAGFGAPHVLAVATPGTILMRCLPANVLTKNAWEYYHKPTDTWSTTYPLSNRSGALWSDGTHAVAQNAISLFRFEHPTQPCWVAIYTGFLQVVVRFSFDLKSWSAAQIVTDTSYFAPDQGIVYGGWPHPYSGKFGNDPTAIYCSVTVFNWYQTLLLKIGFVDPAGVSNEVEDQYNTLRLKPGGRIAEWDSWLEDTHTWVRTGNHTFTIAADARGYLGPSTKVRYDDGAVDYGVVGSVSFASGTTTVNLIPNTSYLMAAGTITAPRYSHSDSPPGFPSAFTYAPTITGYATGALPSSAVYQWSIDKGWIVVHIREAVAGTKDGTATSPTYSLPIAAKNVTNDAWFGESAIRNNVAQNNPCALVVLPGASILTAYSAYAAINTWSPGTLCQIAGGHVRYPFF